MKRPLATGGLIAGSYFVAVLIVAGGSWAIVFVAFVGLVVGAAAVYPVLEALLAEQSFAEEKAAATAWISTDPYGFAKRIADVFAEELEAARGDQLAAAMLGASHLIGALDEISRRASIVRYEDLLRSRTWLP